MQQATESTCGATACVTPGIADVQGSADTRHIAIDKVGIKDIRHPVRVRDRAMGMTSAARGGPRSSG